MKKLVNNSIMEQQQIINLEDNGAVAEDSGVEQAVYGHYQQELIIGNMQGSMIEIRIHQMDENNPETAPTEYYIIEEHNCEEGAVTGRYLHEVHELLEKDLEIQNIDTNALNHISSINPQVIDRMVDMEMERLKANCAMTEENYVQQMLAENPIVIERRNTGNDHVDDELSDDENVDVVTVSESAKKGKYALLQRQRAESCRRSRYNDKIRKAKMTYRHKYMSKKLEDSVQLFNCIQAVIQQAEEHLLHQDFPLNRLKFMRLQYGVDKAIAEAHSMKHVINGSNK